MKVRHTSEFAFGIYCWTLKNPKNQNFEKKKKKYWTYHDFTHVYRKPQSGKVPETRSDIFFCRLGPFFAIPPPPLPNTPENQNFEKKKKASGDMSSF